MAQSLRSTFEAESKYYLSLKAGLLAHIGGQPPVTAVEFARKALMSEVRPTFSEVEAATAELAATA
jgi:chemotaxis protein MotA